jgi:organic radical activating enzyme
MNAQLELPLGLLRHQEVEIYRRTPKRSVLLFITDRCPVGCAHCSVDSKADSPRISDHDLFEALLDGICQNKDIQVVGISGGEPFVERQALLSACERLSTAGKQLVIYTSGVWANVQTTPTWIDRVLGLVQTIYLSTDIFHQQAVPPDCFVRAARAVADAGAWIVVQTLDVEQATELLKRALGPNYLQYSEVVPLTLLTHGRGEHVVHHFQRHEGQRFGVCGLAVTPVVRYDGVVTACCNESVIMGKGPSRLRLTAHSAEQLDEALSTFGEDALLQVVGQMGLGVLTEHPKFRSLAREQFTDPCQLCWKMMERSPARNEEDRLLQAIAKLEV